MTATSGKPIREVPAVVLPPAMAALQKWRNADHEDSIRLSRDDVVTLVEEMHQQLADAQAAQALVVERAAEVARRHHSKVQINEPLWHDGQDWAADRIAEALEALADPSGVEALAALRDEAEKWRSITSDNGRAAMDNLAAIVALESERDALAAKLAAAEARVEALTEALDGAALAMKSARGVIVSKHEHALLTGALVKCAEAKAGVSIPAALTTPAEETKG